MGAHAELWAKSNFSFLEGASHPDELVAEAVRLGLRALALTDRNTLAGVVRAHVAAKEKGLPFIVGAEIVPVDGPAAALLATSLDGYRSLSRLVTCGRRAAVKGECRLTLADMAAHADGLVALLLPVGDDGDPLPAWETLREAFGDRTYVAAAAHLGPDDDAELERTARFARRSGAPLVAVNQVAYHSPARRPMHDVLTAIRCRTTVAALGARRFPNGDRCLQPPAEMRRRFAAYPDAIARTIEIADRCRFSLDELRYRYPKELCPEGTTSDAHLADLTWRGAQARYPAGVPEKVAELLRKELSLIAELSYADYFLTVWDLVRFARERAILCQGRGSAANSAVCYCLGITSVDPERSDVLFERFVSKERGEPPDIDVDFEHERREEVFRYIYAKYGRDRAAIVAETICYRPRSAVRDVAKALGFSPDAGDRLAKTVDWTAEPEALAGRIREAGFDPAASSVRRLAALTAELLSFPRHLSQHVGGFVITDGPLSELVPIENAAMAERTVIEWNKDDVDAVGLLKVDCLALGMLTAIRKCFALIEAHHGVPLTLATVPAEDPATYDMICAADTVGVFQIESRAQMSMLPRLKPRCFYDLVIEVAIVRPGPIQGGMVHPYLRRRNGEEPVTYPSPLVEEVLAKTLGVPLFQEQVMRLAVVAAGYTPGEADQLRRAMAAWKRAGTIEKHRAKFRDGLLARGFSQEFADQIFEQIKGFGEYGFPESHAASFALLAYVSAWLKRHYPAAFTAALLNSQPMGFYAPAQLAYDAQKHGVEVRPVDANRSDWDCTLEPTADGRVALRLGFRLVRGLATSGAEQIVLGRATGPYRSIADVARRSGVGRALLARVAAADGFASLGLDRRAALWAVLDTHEEEPLFASLDEEASPSPLAPPTLDQNVVDDYRHIGLSLKAHPIGLVREELTRLGATTADRLPRAPAPSTVRVAGLVLVRQRPQTANGTVFMSLEDETGLINLILWPRTWERFKKVAKRAGALFVEGKLERAERVMHILPTRVEDLSHLLAGAAPRSRDWA